MAQGIRTGSAGGLGVVMLPSFHGSVDGESAPCCLQWLVTGGRLAAVVEVSRVAKFPRQCGSLEAGG